MLAEYEAEERAFACAVRTDQAVHLTGLQREIHIAGDMQAAKVLVQLAGFQNGH